MWNVIQAQDLFLLFVHKFEIRKKKAGICCSLLLKSANQLNLNQLVFNDLEVPLMTPCEWGNFCPCRIWPTSTFWAGDGLNLQCVLGFQQAVESSQSTCAQTERSPYTELNKTQRRYLKKRTAAPVLPILPFCLQGTIGSKTLCALRSSSASMFRLLQGEAHHNPGPSSFGKPSNTSATSGRHGFR